MKGACVPLSCTLLQIHRRITPSFHCPSHTLRSACISHIDHGGGAMQMHGNKPQDTITLPAYHKTWYQRYVSFLWHFAQKSDNGVIYCAGCLRVLFWSLTLCHLHVPDFALFFVFLLVFSFFLSCCSCWDKLGRKTQTSFPTRLHWCCPLHLSSIASLRIMMFVTGNIRQLWNGALWGKWVYFLGEARNGHFSFTPPAAVPALSWVLVCCWAQCVLLERGSWIWMSCLADGLCPGCLACNSHSQTQFLNSCMTLRWGTFGTFPTSKGCLKPVLLVETNRKEWE